MEHEGEEGDDGGGRSGQNIDLESRKGDGQHDHERVEQEGDEDEDEDNAIPILKSEDDFWNELQSILETQCDSHEMIDEALRAYLQFMTSYKDAYLSDPDTVTRCSYQLLSSSLFNIHGEYIRHQIIYSLLQEDDLYTLHLIVSFLLCDGRHHDATFHAMSDEGAFPRLLELIQYHGDFIGWNDSENEYKQAQGPDDPGLHRLLMDLLYEMSRIQRLKIEDLVLVEDDFIRGLFQIIERVSDDAGDPYHYSVIRVLLVLNEQFMVCAHDPTISVSVNAPTNKVIKVLSVSGNVYKTFGENIILLLNREAETCPQLLTLKLLYLLFTTPPTYEYFYTNDLRVLVDILIRNLLDLPEEAIALRHTYLRVLFPLLANTQLKYPPHYKVDDINRLLGILVHGVFENDEDCYERILHFADVDDTTQRLVARCRNVEWLQASSIGPNSVSFRTPNEGEQATNVVSDGVAIPVREASPDKGHDAMGETSRRETSLSIPAASSDEITSDSKAPVSLLEPKNTAALGMGLLPAQISATSVLEVAAHRAKPGMITPSRSGSLKKSSASMIAGKGKIKPAPPMARRLRGRHIKKEAELRESNCYGEPEAPSMSVQSLAKTGIDTQKTDGIPSNSVNVTPTLPQGDEPEDVPTNLAPQVRNSNTASIHRHQSASSSRSTSSSRHKPALPPPRRSYHTSSTYPQQSAASQKGTVPTSAKPLPISQAPPPLRTKISMPLLLASQQASQRGKPPPLPSSGSRSERTTPTATPSNGTSDNGDGRIDTNAHNICPSQKPVEKPELPKRRRWRSKASLTIDDSPPVSASPSVPMSISMPAVMPTNNPPLITVSFSSSVAELTPISTRDQKGNGDDDDDDDEEWE